MSVFTFICPVFAAALLYAFIILPESYFWTEFATVPKLVGLAEPNKDPNPSVDGIQRLSLKFDSHGIACDAWFYIPVSDTSLSTQDAGFPVVVMAHGLPQVREWTLYKYAELFAKNGFAAFVFDYRYFGGSAGSPRHSNSPTDLVADYVSAVNYVRSSEFSAYIAEQTSTNNQVNIKIDKQRVGIWGTSYAGGHVLPAAAQVSAQPGGPEYLKFVVSQAPYVGGVPGQERYFESFQPMSRTMFFHIWGSVGDMLRSKLNEFVITPVFGERYAFSPLYAKMFGDINSDEMAIIYFQYFNQTEATFTETMPRKWNTDWKNGILLRSILEMMTYRPLAFAEDIDEKIKVAYVVAANDMICPNFRTKYAFEQTKNAVWIEVEGNHMDIYASKFEEATKRTVEFMRKQVA